MTQLIEMMIHSQNHRVKTIPKISQPFSVSNHPVKEIPVGNPEPASISGLMHCLIHDINIAKGKAGKLSNRLIVIARDISHFCALTGFSQDFLDDIVMTLIPEPALLLLPTIDDVADQIKITGLIGF